MEKRKATETYMLNREELVTVVIRQVSRLVALKLKWDRLVELLNDGASIYDDEVDSLVRKISLQFAEWEEGHER